jgi:hypothetical protein
MDSFHRRTTMRPRTFLPTIAGVLVAGVIALIPAAASAQASPVPVASPGSVPSGGAATPEDAVIAYVAGIAEGDADSILAATAVDEMAAGFDFQAQAERLNALMLVTGLAPAEYPLFAESNRYQQAALILGQVRNLVYGLLSDEEIDGAVIAPADPERVGAFVAAVDPARLAGLSVVDVRLPDPEHTTSERYLATVAEAAAVYGADEMVERLGLVELDGTTYGVGFTLLRYGDTWGVSSQSSVMSGTSPLGVAEPMTQQEFDARTGR